MVEYGRLCTCDCFLFATDKTRHHWLKLGPLLTSPGLFLNTILYTLSASVCVCVCVCVFVCVYAESFAENVLSFLTKIATAQKFISSTEWSVYTMCTRDHKEWKKFRELAIHPLTTNSVAGPRRKRKDFYASNY